MATTRGGLEAAVLVNRSTGEEVPFMFNPHEYSLDKSNEWTPKPAKGKNVPLIEFEKGGAQSLKLQLFFDTYTQSDQPVDVRSYTDLIWKMMMVDETKKHQESGKSSPPKVEFRWGTVTFLGVIKSLSQKFTMFTDKGVPVRTTVDITLQQVVDDEEQPAQPINAQPASEQQSVTTSLSDRLDTIAAETTGDPSDYRKIAEANDIDNPKKVPPGTNLTIPS
ncbi:MAG: hypothetical protein GYB66_01520 [Chloroflexi bacterium]|nr:hypothetical protein [Chloroflexota bacterium]